jgi:hypothetical protein
VVNQVEILGAVYNLGGIVEADGGGGAMLALEGQDANGYSYWQKTSPSAQLKVGVGGQISGDGIFQIDIGTVQLTAPGGGSTDALNVSALDFGNANATSLTIVDSMLMPGQVNIQGEVNLAQNTRTTMNFSAATNTADLLMVQNAPLTLNGSLRLVGDQKPTQPLTFFADSAQNPFIFGNFSSITDNVGGTNDTSDTGLDWPFEYYRVTIQ